MKLQSTATILATMAGQSLARLTAPTGGATQDQPVQPITTPRQLSQDAVLDENYKQATTFLGYPYLLVDVRSGDCEAVDQPPKCDEDLKSDMVISHLLSMLVGSLVMPAAFFYAVKSYQMSKDTYIPLEEPGKAVWHHLSDFDFESSDRLSTCDNKIGSTYRELVAAHLLTESVSCNDAGSLLSVLRKTGSLLYFNVCYDEKEWVVTQEFKQPGQYHRVLKLESTGHPDVHLKVQGKKITVVESGEPISKPSSITVRNHNKRADCLLEFTTTQDEFINAPFWKKANGFYVLEIRDRIALHNALVEKGILVSVNGRDCLKLDPLNPKNIMSRVEAAVKSRDINAGSSETKNLIIAHIALFLLVPNETSIRDYLDTRTSLTDAQKDSVAPILRNNIHEMARIHRATGSIDSNLAFDMADIRLLVSFNDIESEDIQSLIPLIFSAFSDLLDIGLFVGRLILLVG